MVNIDLFTIVALNMVVLKLGYTALDCYIKPPRFMATIEHISDEPGSIAANRTKSILFLTWHESSEPTKEPICDYVTTSSLQQHNSSTPCKISVCDSITPMCMPDSASQVIDDVMRQLSFEKTKLDREAGIVDVAGSGVESSGISHDESFRVDDLDLNLNEPVSTQEPILADVSTHVSIVEEVGTQEFTIEDVVLEDYVSSGEDAKQCNGQEDESAHNKENEIIEPDVDIYLFGISIDLPFDNMCVTNLVPDVVLKGEDVDVINPDGFDSDPGNDDETNDYRRRRIMEMKPDIENMTLNEYLEYEAKKERRLWDHVRSRRNLTNYDEAGVDFFHRNKKDVIQPLIPTTLHITPPNEDYVAPATKPILDELLEDKILNVAMVNEVVDPTRDLEVPERLLVEDPYFMEM
uniref:Uncharacterized protein n=1 Tax=Tanacetum cinerariifolium TaxID=118510 RepID=A0A6L2P2A4_TANCI|nr:hypothetical protein [Tanacetum cinerariifolium]